VQRWNLPEGWVISRHPAHSALDSEADFIAAQDATAPRGPAGPAARRYLLACGRCGRRLESAWSNGKPAYRCRHGYSSATRPEPGRPKNAYVREDQILPHLAAVAIVPASDGKPKDAGTVQVTISAEMATALSPSRWARTPDVTATAVSRERRPDRFFSTRRGRRPGPGDNTACAKTANHGVLTCPRT
jgi:hypothetical protein